MPTEQQEIEFSDLLNRNCQIISSICLRYCGGNAFYFEELRQVCALAIWEEYSCYGLSRFRGDSAESTWIHQISYHAVIDYFRNPKHAEFPSLCDPSELEQKLQNVAFDDWQLLDELTTHLNNRERNLLGHYLCDDSYNAIARTEGITEPNARQQMSRLIKKLKMLVHLKY